MKKHFPTLLPAFIFLTFGILFGSCDKNSKTGDNLPEGFVYIIDVVPNLVLDVRYNSNDNFMGRVANGYENSVCIMTTESAEALKLVAEEVALNNYRLKVFDAYRPQRAVDDFISWSQVLDDTITKAKYYPNIPKKDLFELNYLALKSGHSRGSTLDLTLIDENGDELDMGSGWDYFGPESWPTDTTVSQLAQDNRNILRSVMLKHGFIPYNEEWWHFTLDNEPYPDTYFDFINK
jgi:D-alanyl-D-alanine dipeptidase